MSAIDRTPIESRRPSTVLQWALLSPREIRPILLAEYWHLLMAGVRHDPVYILAVALDVWGTALSSPAELLAETLVVAPSRALAPSPWRLRGGLSRGERHREKRYRGERRRDERHRDERHRGLRHRGLRQLMKTALLVLSEIPPELDFVAEWKLVRLRPLLEKAGLLDEALRLAMGLTNRFGTRDDTFRRLLGSEIEETSTAISGEIEKRHIPCDFGDRERQLQVYLGRPAPGYHRLHFQTGWVRSVHGGEISQEVMAELR